jgi:MoaA/NifB/PqqE/SkfB family radical SAM enzyme
MKAKWKGNPYKVTYAVTYKCNARCTICNIWEKYVKTPQKRKEELTLYEIDALFNNFDLSWISLTGGEPFLRDDLTDIVCAVEKNNPHLHLLTIPTNGSLPTRILKTVEYILEETEIPNVYVSVSVDGDESLHDRLRGVKGLWKKARKTYALLNTVEHERFNVYVEYTVSKYNAGHLQCVLDSLEVTDSQVVLTAAHSSYFYCTDKSELHTASSLSQVDQYTRLHNNGGAERILPWLYANLLKKYLQGSPTIQCVSGQSSFFLDPYGFLYPCISMNAPFGNIKESSLQEIMQTEKALTIVNTIKDRKCPGCWTPCEAYQSILEHLPRAFMRAYLK